MRTIFSSNYNALQVKVDEALQRQELIIDANFTWSRDLTNSPADYSGFIQNIYNLNGGLRPRFGRSQADPRTLTACGSCPGTANSTDSRVT